MLIENQTTVMLCLFFSYTKLTSMFRRMSFVLFLISLVKRLKSACYFSYCVSNTILARCIPFQYHQVLFITAACHGTFLFTFLNPCEFMFNLTHNDFHLIGEIIFLLLIGIFCLFSEQLKVKGDVRVQMKTETKKTITSETDR